jgi:hypothetical protein
VPRFVILVIVATRRLGTKNSNGTTTSCPYTNMNSVCLVNFLHVVLYAHNIVGIFKSQPSLLTLQIFVNAFYRILIKATTVHLLEGDMVYSFDYIITTPKS